MDRTVLGVVLLAIGFLITAFFAVGALFSLGPGGSSAHPGGVGYLLCALLGLALMMAGWWLTSNPDRPDGL